MDTASAEQRILTVYRESIDALYAKRAEIELLERQVELQRVRQEIEKLGPVKR